MADIGKDISQAKHLLDAGELVSIPTETVYGLAGNALSSVAVASIFETKDRPSFDPLIIHVASLLEAKNYVTDIPVSLNALAERFWPGPLTLLLPKNNNIPDIVTAGLERVAVRVPDHPLTLELLSQLAYPLAAPSANPFGYISPTSPQHVQAQLGEKISYILDGGKCKVGLESTIVGMEDDEIIVYRLGGLDISEIEELVGPVTVKSYSTSNPQAPGLLETHYSPSKPFLIGDLDELISKYLGQGDDFAVLSLDKSFSVVSGRNQIALSPNSDLKEAATHLFAAMRKLDESNATIILAELMPDTGLGRAINDRLKRAATKE
ncbi:L-threonylcarbamoyladenylate synthase [Algoriphagus ratkowskyi]|uniref:Threonylcarbamoyl-AMP synthase n=1 Tax=Algoriphagus ratkowskyi TaxID=57028 RepID=A0A2W7QXN7_9BACT|nr:L-threonylcarbamoyladenylate synthase [Algoriphagus ratkowskyi]PZX51876.1 L-threonylcarbamoyladenylate synthase [Algoriphagus ratkowskyi]TXD75994.1 threonylcarbamoyl-AMP synthase [Algoriphagus ratkowskyi]